MFGRKAKKIEELQRRVEELEERLCPFNQHDWVKIGSSFITTNGFDFTDIYKYKCRRCGKIKESMS